MRIFTDPIEMFREVKRDLFEMGSRYESETVQDKVVTGNEAKTIELFGYAYALKNATVDSARALIKEIDGNMAWALSEAEERVGRRPVPQLNPGEAWKIRSDFWEKFLRDGFFSYTYGERWVPQIPLIVEELKRRPNSRQAILMMYSSERDSMNWGGRDRVPCSVSYQFVIRDGKLNIVYNQRSCDFVKFFGYDVYFTVALMNHVAARLNVEPGTFIHFLGSLHAFAADLEGENIF